MLNRSDLYNYQDRMVKFIVRTLRCGLFLDMSLGKTVITLTAIDILLKDFLVTKVLIVAPLRVANTVWKQEAANWKHLKDLKIEICTGSPTERMAILKKKNVDIVVVNVENVVWVTQAMKWQFDMVVLDEGSLFKSMKSKRFRALRKVTKDIEAIVDLTGTPNPQSYMDLWPQLFLLDSGERLGRTITNYRQKYFTQSGYMGYGYKINPGSADKINAAISDICCSMDGDDYLNLPKKIFKNEYVEFTPELKRQYKEFLKDSIMEMGKDKVIEALSAAALTSKLLQFCQGAIYDSERKVHHIHDLKIEALKEIIELNPNENMFIAYNFKHDLARLKKAFPKAVVLSKSGAELKQWNEGKIKQLLVHPASAGHGLNAQYGGSVIIWFGLTFNLEHYLQFNARLHRIGQTKPVRIIHILIKGSLEERVLKALTNKEQVQENLLEYLKYDM